MERVDRIVIYKSRHRLEAWSGKRLVKVCYEVADVFESDGQADRARSDVGPSLLGLGQAANLLQRWRHHQRFGRTEARGNREKLQPFGEA